MKNRRENIKRFKLIALFITLSLGYNNISGQQLYPASFDITTLNGTNGFVIPGIDPSSQFGAETKFIGDINNDGFEDIGIGVNNADINGLSLAGAAYIIFGTNTAFSDSFDINTLDGTNGFAVQGLVGSKRMGSSIEGVGDINGDGIDDLIIVYSGTSIVIYGKTTSFNASFNIDYADGVNGFLINGSANEVGALGDVNGDGISDFVLSRAGSAALIFFGQSTNFPATINSSWLDGTTGFSIKGYSGSTIPAFLAGGAGDINNDGINDINIGDWYSAAGGKTHLIYGRNTFPSQLDVETMTITEGFTVDHTGGNFLAFTGTLGDINNDGIDDFFSEQAAIYGRNGASPFPAHIPLSSITDGTYGFVLPGKLTSTSIGDINQDGINDFISCYDSGANSGFYEAYVVFGSTSGFPNPIDRAALTGMNGFVVPFLKTSNIGRPVSGGGDFNGDGISDFLVGSPGTKLGTPSVATGQVTVILGGDHYAMPLNTGNPQANNETTTGFNILVNGPETGTIHYTIVPNTFFGTVNHNVILTGTGAVANGNFLMNTANTDITKVISSLTASTTYDIYLFLEDSTGNQSEIYKIDNITTLVEPTASFITTWETTTANESITIPTSGGGYNYTIDWGDGTVLTNQNGTRTHTYTTAGIHTVSISGDFPRIYFHPASSPAGNNNKILTIEQWGDIKWTSMSYAFYQCSNLNITNTSIDTPDLSLVTSTGDMFYGASNFNYDIGNWDVSKVTTMRFMFRSANVFNQDLSDWNVSNVTNLYFMFWGATSFNQDLKKWDVSKVTTMKSMFRDSSFDQDISDWNVSSVTDMTTMFHGVTLSVANYDALLKGWSTQALQLGVTFSGGNSKYCTAETERQSIIDTYGWIISDGGKIASPTITAIPDIIAPGSYTLPAISGVNLSGNEKYYTQTLGGGTAYSAGDILNYADFTTYPITLYVYDTGSGCGESEKKFKLIIQLNDIINPTASNPLPINIQCSTVIPAPNPLVVTDEADNSGTTPTVAFVNDVTDGNSNPEIITRTYSVTDSAGNSTNVTQTITVNDTTNPTASNPSAINVQCTADIPSVDIAVVTDEADNCTTNPTVTFIGDLSDGNTNPELITRTYRITDAVGNTTDVTQTITVNDTTNPTASNPSAINVQCTADIPAANVTLVIDEADNCTTNPTVTFIGDLSDGNTNPELITRTYRISDAVGNTTDVTQTITVNDTTNPTASNPSTINVQCTADIPAANVTLVIDEADNCTTNPTVTFIGDLSDGNTNPELITRTYRITDASGNTTDVTQTITVNDTTNPTASNPSAINVQCTADIPAADVTIVIDEADNCTTNPTVTFIGDLSDGNTNPELITRTYRITDAVGNTTDVTQTITVNDTTNPTASNPSAINVQCTADIPSVDIAVVTDEADNCTTNPTVTFIGDVSDGNTNPELITRTYRIADTAGNTTDVTQTITVNDTTNPTASNPSAINVQCTADIPSVDIAVVTDEADNCIINPTVTFIGDLSDGNTNPELITRTYRISDAAGNTTDVIQTITVNDTTNPEIICPKNITQKADSGFSTAIVTYDSPIVTDNCIGVIISQTAGLPSGSEFPIGITTITFEVSDQAGNINACSFNIIIEVEDPIVCDIDAGEDEDIIEGEEVQLNAVVPANGTLQWSPSEGLNNTSIVNPIANPTETTTYTLRYTNNQGCIVEDTVTVSVTALRTDETKYGFSPDGDGINEYWEIDGIDNYPNNKVLIYNRWGDLVFEVTGYNNTSKVFEGIANRKRNFGADILPEGTYFFQIKIEGTHHLKKETGFLVLKR